MVLCDNEELTDDERQKLREHQDIKTPPKIEKAEKLPPQQIFSAAPQAQMCMHSRKKKKLFGFVLPSIALHMLLL